MGLLAWPQVTFGKRPSRLTTKVEVGVETENVQGVSQYDTSALPLQYLLLHISIDATHIFRQLSC